MRPSSNDAVGMVSRFEVSDPSHVHGLPDSERVASGVSGERLQALDGASMVDVMPDTIEASSVDVDSASRAISSAFDAWQRVDGSSMRPMLSPDPCTVSLPCPSDTEDAFTYQAPLTKIPLVHTFLARVSIALLWSPIEDALPMASLIASSTLAAAAFASSVAAFETETDAENWLFRASNSIALVVSASARDPRSQLARPRSSVDLTRCLAVPSPRSRAPSQRSPLRFLP